MKEVEIRRKELEGETVSCKVTPLEAKSRNLADLILYVLGELYSNHGLDLFDQSGRLYIYMTRDDLLYPFLAGSCPSFSLPVANTGVLRDYLIDDNLILILLVYVCIYCPRTVFVSITISRSFWIFMRYSERELILYRYISHNFKEVFKREKVVSLDRELTKFMEGSHN